LILAWQSFLQLNVLSAIWDITKPHRLILDPAQVSLAYK